MDPLYILATEMAKDHDLICFDEFQVINHIILYIFLY